MAVPTYSTDLQPIYDANNNTNWYELTGHTSGGADAYETDYFIQGAGCVSQSTGVATAQTAGLQFDYLSDMSSSMSTGYCFFTWMIFLPANAITAWASGGIRFGVGSSAGNMNFWNAVGSDFGRNPYGGWQNIAIDPTFTPDQTDGTPTSAYQFFGSMPNIASAVSKGNPHGVDAIRYGRGQLVITDGSLADGYGTFSGLAAKNDANDATDGYNRWGLFQAEGTGYLWKGLMSLGTASTACQFVDSNKNITVDNTPRTYATFNKIEISNASSIIDWTNINFIALSASQLSRGDFQMVDNATVGMDSCSFTDMNTFIFNSNATIVDSTFRRCGQITGGGGAFDSCTLANSTAAVTLVLTNLNQATDCTFGSDGSNHAVDLGTVSGTTSMNWNNYLTGYAVSDGSSGNEAIKVNVAASQILTINVGAGYSTPSIYNTGSGTVSVVSGQVTTSVIVQALSDGSVILGARVLIWATDNINKLPNSVSSITGSGTTATVTQNTHGLATGDYVIISGVTNDDDYNGVHQITKINDNSYSYTADDTLTSPATGATIVAKWAILSGTTDVNGYAEDIRSFSFPQPIQGWVRKTSGSPYYQQGAISGTINTSNGFSTTVQLAIDE